MTVFVIIAAVALIIQAAMLAGIYKASRGLQENVQRLTAQDRRACSKPRARPSRTAVSRSPISPPRPARFWRLRASKCTAIDEFLDDAAARARVQMDRAEMVLDDAMVRTQRTVAVVEGGILKPIMQIQGVAAGIKTALTFLLRGRPNPEDAHSDEEMFI